jgi:hypothetical protein
MIRQFFNLAHTWLELFKRKKNCVLEKLREIIYIKTKFQSSRFKKIKLDIANKFVKNAKHFADTLITLKGDPQTFSISYPIRPIFKVFQILFKWRKNGT